MEHGRPEAIEIVCLLQFSSPSLGLATISVACYSILLELNLFVYKFSSGDTWLRNQQVLSSLLCF